ncbi:MAG: LuxR C-terminal-related transcriptional regulator [Dehalococcoidia bacterium]
MRRGRPPYPELLTPREQEVLELIAEGLTNEQIAERLGISFGGAKYHVAEILSKLAVESRHEAVQLFRSRQTRRSRFAALTPLLFWRREGGYEPATMTKIAVIGALAVAAIIGAFLVAPSFGLRNDNRGARDPLEAISADIGFDAQGNLVQRGPASTLDSYYYEAKVETGPRPSAPGDRRPESAQLPELHPTQIRSWYHAGEGSRWDALDGTQLVYRRVADEDTRWAYEGQSNTYQQYPLSLEDTRNAEVGPLPPGGVAGLFNAQEWKPAGQEVISGRITQIVERTASDLLERIWVDTEYDFVLKHEYNDRVNPHRITEVTRIEYNRAVSSQELALDLPSEARELPTVTGQVSTGESLGPFGGPGGHAVSPKGMLDLTYAPAGLGAQGAGGTSRLISPTETMTVGYVVWYAPEHDSPASFVVTQQYRAGGMPQGMAVGDPVSVRNGTGYRESIPGEERLVFEAGDIIVTLTSTALPFDELVKIAEGMQ